MVSRDADDVGSHRFQMEEIDLILVGCRFDLLPFAKRRVGVGSDVDGVSLKGTQVGSYKEALGGIAYPWTQLVPSWWVPDDLRHRIGDGLCSDVEWDGAGF